MAQRTQVILEDDIDGGLADETLTFALDGATYEIELTERNADSLRDALAPFISAGRRVGGRRTAARKSSASATNQIREWARANGYTVSDRGRVSAEITEAYEKATR